MPKMENLDIYTWYINFAFNRKSTKRKIIIYNLAKILCVRAYSVISDFPIVKT